MDYNNQKKILVIILLLIGISFGCFLRISYTLKTNFPINDGGLFLTMTKDIIENHYSIPRFTSYNHANIPFAYPPASFYSLAFLHDTFKIPLLDLFRFYPLFFNILGLFLIYPIARLIVDSERRAVLATFAFSIIQPAYTWLLMGGGVTRSPAQFFSLLAILFTLLFFKNQKKWVWLAGSVISISLTAYFHIEIAFINSLIMIFLALRCERSRNTLQFLMTNALAGLILLSPYLLKVTSLHGIEPFISAFSSGYTDQQISIGILLIPIFTGETIFPILAVLGVLGVFASIATRQITPILWIILISIINPRSVHRTAALPEALLIAASLELFILHGLETILQRNQLYTSALSKGFPDKLKPPIFPYFSAASILIYAFLLSSVEQNVVSSPVALSLEERSAFSWVSSHTQPDASFLIIPSIPSWGIDWISEWFPTLTDRHSLITGQGYEWKKDQFQKKLAAYNELNACIESTLPCFTAWRNKNNISFDYLLIPKRFANHSIKMLESQGVLDGCNQAYQNTEIEIFHCAQN